jgi:hypothetical protein
MSKLVCLIIFVVAVKNYILKKKTKIKKKDF